MDEISALQELLCKKRIKDAKIYKQAAKQQLDQHQKIIKQLQTIKDDRVEAIESINKNLSTLTAHKHVIQKLVHDSDVTPGLPISHDYQQQAVSFFCDSSNFMNNLSNIYDTLDNEDKEANIDTDEIIDSIGTCATTMGNELHRVQSFQVQVETLKRNMEFIQKNCFVNSDDTELDGSIS